MIKMVYKFSCKDLGSDCPFHVEAENVDQLISKVSQHVKEHHGFTKEQLMYPKMREKLKSVIKTE